MQFLPAKRMYNRKRAEGGVSWRSSHARPQRRRERCTDRKIERFEASRKAPVEGLSILESCRVEGLGARGRLLHELALGVVDEPAKDNQKCQRKLRLARHV
jgi:hypothetical protein